jgi:hypothetical protein
VRPSWDSSIPSRVGDLCAFRQSCRGEGHLRVSLPSRSSVGPRARASGERLGWRTPVARRNVGSEREDVAGAGDDVGHGRDDHRHGRGLLRLRAWLYQAGRFVTSVVACGSVR